MAANNGSTGTYVDLDKLRNVPRIEEDVEVEGLGMFRVQAVTHEEARRARMACRIEEGTQIDTTMLAQYEVAFGTIRPNIAELMNDVDTEHEALETVKGMHPTIVAKLARAIQDLSYIEPSEAYRRFFDTATSLTS